MDYILKGIPSRKFWWKIRELSCHREMTIKELIFTLLKKELDQSHIKQNEN